MVSPEETAQVEAIRKQIADEKAKINTARGSVPSNLSQNQLRTNLGGIESLPARNVFTNQRSQALGQIGDYETQVQTNEQTFEEEIAKALPELAKPDLVEINFNQATGELSSKIANLDQQIQEKKQDLAEYKSQPNWRDSTADTKERSIRLLEAKKQGYNEVLSDNKFEVVKKFFGGYADQLANYYRDKLDAEFSNQDARKEARQAEQARQDKIKADMGGWKGSVQEIKVLPSGQAQLLGIKTYGEGSSDSYVKEFRLEKPLEFNPSTEKLSFLSTDNSLNININSIGNISSSLSTQPTSNQTNAVMSMPSTPDRIRGFIRQETGVSLPSLTQAFNLFTLGTEYGEPQAKITPSRVLASFVDVPSNAVNLVWGNVENSLTPLLEKAGVPTLTRTLPEMPIYQKSTLMNFGQPNEKPAFSLPETNITTLSPSGLSKGIASVGNFASQLLLLRRMPMSLASTSLMASGYQPFSSQFRNTSSFDEKLGGALSITTGAILGAGWLKTPSVVKVKEGEVVSLNKNIDYTYTKKPSFYAKDEIFPFVKNGKAGAVGKFDLIRVTPPEFVKVYPNKLARVFFEPEIIQSRPVRFDLAKGKVFVNDLGESKANVISFRKGARMAYLSDLRGSSRPITPEEFSGLPQTQKLEFQNLAERKTGGIPVSMENVPMMLSKEAKFSVGSLQNTKWLRYSPKSKIAQLWVKSYGNRITRSDVANEATSYLKTPEYELFNTRTATKDVTFPRLKSTSRGIDFIKGESKVWETKNLDEFSNSGEVQGSNSGFNGLNIIELKPVVKEGNIKQIAKQKIADVKAFSAENFPKVKPAELPKIKPDTTLKVLGLGSAVISEAKPVQSSQGAYYGLGQYERTEGGLMPQEKTNQINFIEPTIKTIQTQIPQVMIKQNENLILKEDMLMKHQLKEDLLLNNKSLLKENVKFKEALESSQILGSQLKLSLKQRQLEKQLQRPVPTFRPPTPRPEPPRQKTKIKLKLPLIVLPKAKEPRMKISSRGESLFIPIVKRKGKFKEASSPVSFSQALAIGSSKVQRSLARTFGIKSAETGKLVNPSIFGKTFRPAKRNPLLAVQRSRYALSSKQEKEEILLSRKRRKQKWF